MILKLIIALLATAGPVLGWYFSPSQLKKRRQSRDRNKLQKMDDYVAKGDADNISDSLDDIGL